MTTPIRAAVSRSEGAPLAVEELLLSPPGPGEVRVRVAASAICHSDLSFIAGDWGPMPPTVYGHEVAGVVEEVGAGVSSVSVGDHVVATLIRHCGTCFFCARGEMTQCSTRFALDEDTRLRARTGEPVGQGVNVGGFAEQVVVHESQVVGIPAGLPFDLAAPVACGLATGFGSATRTAAVPGGSSVAVVGCGGVGLGAIQGSRIAGSAPIVAVDLAPSKLESAAAFGATHTAGPAMAEEVVQEITDGRGVDFAFVTAGSGKAIDLAMKLMRRGGALVVVGMPADGVATQLELGYLAAAGQRILGSKMGSIRPREDIPEMVRLYDEGKLMLAEMISGRYGLEQINDAIDDFRAGNAIRNVIVFD